MADKNKLILDISARLDELNAEVAKARGELKGLKGGVNSVDETIKKGSKDWQKSFSQFGLAIQGVKQAMAILGRTFGDAIRTIAKFQTAMTEVNTLLNLTTAQFNQLQGQVVALSKEIPQTAEQLSKGLYQVVSAGVDAGDAMAFLETASKGAVAGLTDTQTSVDAITSVINAYGMEASEAEKVSDIFFQTVKLGKTTFAEMAPTLGQVIPIASAFGVSFEEVAGAFATMTKSGIPTARTATSIGRTINEIVKPASKAELAIRKLGFASGQSAIDQLGLQGTIQKLTESGINMTSIFGDESLKAVLALGKSAESTSADLDAMNSSAGATNEAFFLMNNTLENQASLVKNKLESYYLNFGKILIPGWTTALRDLNAVMDQHNAITKATVTAGKTDKDIALERATAMEALIRKYKDLGVENSLGMVSSKGMRSELQNLGISLHGLATVQDLVNRLQDESNSAIESATTLTHAEKEAIAEANAEKQKELELEKAKKQVEAEKAKQLQEKQKQFDLAQEEAEWLEEWEKKQKKIEEDRIERIEKEISENDRIHQLRIRLNAEWEKSEEDRIQNEWDRVDRLRELGTISTKDYLSELIKRRDAETTSSEMRESLEGQIEQLGIERFARLRQGWKEFLKGEILDFITAKQIEMLGTLAEIWATGGATLGASLAVALPLYGTGIAILEGAKQAVTAFAEGGRVDSPTVALIGEAGAEFVAPEANFEKYSKDTLTPMIQGQVEAKLMRDGGNGMLAGGLAGVQDSVDRLTKMVAKPMSVISGTQIKLINARMNRGSLGY